MPNLEDALNGVKKIINNYDYIVDGSDNSITPGCIAPFVKKHKEIFKRFI